MAARGVKGRQSISCKQSATAQSNFLKTSYQFKTSLWMGQHGTPKSICASVVQAYMYVCRAPRPKSCQRHCRKSCTNCLIPLNNWYDTHSRFFKLKLKIRKIIHSTGALNIGLHGVEKYCVFDRNLSSRKRYEIGSQLLYVALVGSHGHLIDTCHLPSEYPKLQGGTGGLKFSGGAYAPDTHRYLASSMCNVTFKE